MKLWDFFSLSLDFPDHAGAFFADIFKLRLLRWRKLRLSARGLCVLGCFFGLELEP